MAGGRGITIRINRQEAIRMLGAAIREKTQEFSREKKALPKATEKFRALIIKRLKERIQEAERAKTLEKLKSLDATLFHWKEQKVFPSVPTLNVCALKNFLDMLQHDTRKVIPINSNSLLWMLLKDKCEVIQ